MKKQDVRQITPGTGDWAKAQKAAEALRETGYDFDAWRQQREVDANHANMQNYPASHAKEKD